MNLALVLTPHGALTFRREGETATPEPAHGARLEAAFGRGAGHGLLSLGADAVAAALPPVLAYWRELGARYVTALCALPGIAEGWSKPPVPARWQRRRTQRRRCWTIATWRPYSGWRWPMMPRPIHPFRPQSLRDHPRCTSKSRRTGGQSRHRKGERPTAPTAVRAWARTGSLRRRRETHARTASASRVRGTELSCRRPAKVEGAREGPAPGNVRAVTACVDATKPRNTRSSVGSAPTRDAGGCRAAVG